MNYFVEGDSKRLFLNTRIGCRARCKYCYIQKLNFHGWYNKTAQPNDIANYIETHTDFKKGKDGTIFSIGCYSECWDSINKGKTKILLEILLKWGNPIQVATKMEIKLSEIKPLTNKIKWKNQLSVYISCPVLTNSNKYEINVKSPQERLKTISVCSNLDIPAILYIKPVLKNITIKDIEKYIQIVKKHKVSVVVGESFSLENNNHPAPIGKGFLFCNKVSEEQQTIVKALSKYTNVYHNSSEIVESYRNLKNLT